MVRNEADDVFLMDAVDIVSIPAMAACALETIPQPAVLNPTDNLVVILAQAQFKLAHCVIVRLRHGRDVWMLLGWTRPARIHLVAALVGGIGVGFGIDIIARV